jgi:type I restriction enzyme, S subunit
MRPYMRAANVTWAGLNLEDVKEMDFSPAEYDIFALRNGDVLVGEASGSRLEVGKSAIWRGEVPGACFQNTVIRVRPGEAVLPEFLQKHLQYDALRGALANIARGIGIHHLGAAGLSEWQIAIAPMAEQKRIVAKLDTLLERVDACRQRLDRVPAILKRLRQGVLAAAASGELTKEWRGENPSLVDASGVAATLNAAHEGAGGHKAGNAAQPTEGVHDLTRDLFPMGWCLLTLRDLVQPDRPITYGILKPGPELEDGVPYIRVADFPGERLNLATIRKTSPAMDEQFKRSRLKQGDLLLSIRGTVGRLIVTPAELERANITQDTARLSIQPVVNPLYVLWVLRSELAQKRMRRAVKGVAVRGINIGDVRALQVPLPSRAEQDEIVRRIEEVMTYCYRVAGHYKVASQSVERLTSSILGMAFRGELVPQDPNDEPADILLQRLATEPSATKAPPRRRTARLTRRELEAVTKKLINVLAETKGWLPAQEAFRRCGVLNDPTTDGIEAIYAELRELERSKRVVVEAVRDRHGRKTHDKLKLIGKA